jgi:TRAP-type uncharacterized transport system fused permease subunit
MGVTMATIGIVIQVIAVTGLGEKLSMLIEQLAVDISIFGFTVEGFFIALIVTAVCCAILGMGMPTTAAYVLLAVLGGPAIIRLLGPKLVSLYGQEWTQQLMAVNGVGLTAHMFIFYFAILSAITPPVAIAALVGAKMAEAPYFATAIMAVKFAVVGFVVPFLFIYNPAILALGSPINVVFFSCIALVAFVALSASAQAYFVRNTRPVERILFLACAIFLGAFVIMLNWFLFLIGIICGAVATGMQLAVIPAVFSRTSSVEEK